MVFSFLLNLLFLRNIFIWKTYSIQYIGCFGHHLFDPWLELKLVFLLIVSELEPYDSDSAELNVFWHKNKALFLLVLKDGVSWLKKEAQDVGANGNRRFFWFIISFFDATNAIGMIFLSLEKRCCVADDTGGVIALIIVCPRLKACKDYLNKPIGPTARKSVQRCLLYHL
jgi:hypothetical protein